MKLPPAVWDWSGGYIGGHIGGRVWSNPLHQSCGQSIYGDADGFDVTRRHNPLLSFG
ncbi:hypothetical protein [Bradyrhizobium sp. 5.13L]